MAVQFRTLHRNPILEKGYELQKVCLGGNTTRHRKKNGHYFTQYGSIMCIL